MSSKLKINSQEAQTFLSYFEKLSPFLTFQTFHHKKAELARVIHGDFKSCLPKLFELHKQRAGIFFMVNAGNGQGRSNKNVEKVRSVFVDLDGSPIEPVLNSPLTPHIVIETSENRFHAYWLVNDCPISDFSLMQAALANKFNGDPKVKDLARVMRVPGFYNFKTTPFLCKIKLSKELPPYSTQEIIRKLNLDLSEEANQYSTQFDYERVLAGGIKEGERNDQLHRLAWHLFSDGKSPEEVESQLIEVNNKLPSPIAINELQNICASATKHFWGDALTLRGATEASVSYPIDALPTKIKAAILEYQSYGQQPIPLVASAALANLSLACQGIANVARNDRLVSPISLYFMVVADSGERKTSADNAFGQPLREWERQKRKILSIDIAEFEAKKSSWASQYSGLELKIKSQAGKVIAPSLDNCDNLQPTNLINQCQNNDTDLQKLEAQLIELKSSEPKRILLPFLFYESVTQEKLIEDLADGWPSTSIWSNEAGLIVGGHSMSREQALKFLALFNKLWDGDTVSRKTRGSGDHMLLDRRLTISMMLQDAVFRQFITLNDGISRNVGYFSRTLLTQPESTMGRRLYKEPPIDTYEVFRYGERLKELINLSSPNSDGNLDLFTLQLSKNAKEIWVAYHDEIELEQNGKWSNVRDFASRSPENAARIAANFHLFECGAEGEISEVAMSQGIQLARWYLNEANRIMTPLSNIDDIQNAQALLEWLSKQSESIIAIRNIQREGPNPTRKRPALIRALAILEKHNYIRFKGGKTKILIRWELI